MKRDEWPVVVVLGSEDSHRLISDALEDQEVRLEWLREPEGLGVGSLEPAAVMVDRDLIPGPATVADWLESGRLLAPVPLLLLTRQRPDAAALQDWLRAGVWDVVTVQVDAGYLGLRLRNLLGHRRGPLPGRTWILPNRPYSWHGLLRATDETLDLCRRFERPISCMAMAVEDPDDTPDSTTPTRLRHRLGVATREWVRGSDLVGISDSGTLLVVLPDTPLEEARLLTARLVATLERRLAGWGLETRLDAHCTIPAPDQTASEFLLGATRGLG